MSLRLSLEDTLKALNTNNKLDGINIVLSSSLELEEVLLALTESFDFNSEMLSDIENIVKGQIVEMPLDFVKKIHRIKESKNGFNALMFCLKHFGFDQIDEALPKLFGMKLDPYLETIKKLDNFRPKVGKKKKKPDIVIAKGEMVFQRLVMPIETSRRDNPHAIAVYTPTGVKTEKHLNKVFGVGLEELPNSSFEKELNNWPVVTRGVYGGYLSMLRRSHIIEIKKNGVERVITGYH